ncbi:nucleoside hydrolase [Bifidobacterium vansinderenii]|uniref:Nucleoside hydrolase n=1 Tax=Bifidobacterium vansinderenii TaxID=1984871 RepID=A0A229VXE4_9BIFI|nr:nucleoside hydrolase [Bifidobacterium vansinderenii]OXN00308.1 nucleoside hydrolase [Bifidobacterium vansinderenii]
MTDETRRNDGRSRTRIVLDVDTGIDDTLALAYLLASPEADLLGVIGVYGNVTAETAVRNNRDVLRLFGRPDVPVMHGMPRPLWADCFEVDEGCARFHGANGLGNVDPAECMGDAVSAGADAGGSGETVDAAPGEVAGGMPASGHRTLTGSAEPVLPGEGVHTFAARGRVKSVGGYRAEGEAELEEVVAAERAVRRAETEGVKFIVDAVRRYGREVTILATGPLTDVAAAIEAAPDIVDSLRVVMMGGALTQEGNCYDLVCETNIIQDPEAANRVFRSGADVTMIGLDVTHQCLLTRADAQTWRDTGTARGRFLADMVEFYINANEDADPMFLAGSPLHDPLAAAVALDPTLVTCFDINMMVETRTGDGHGFRGRAIGDPTRLRSPRKTAHVALGVDAGRFVPQFRDRVVSICR